MSIDFKKDFAINQEAGSRVKITGEISFAELSKYRAASIRALGKNVKIDGFREGHVPENILVSKVGEMAILAEMAERALAAIYPDIVKENGLETIGHPKIELTKIAPNNPLGFNITVSVLPEITLGDYQAIAKELNKEKVGVEITDAELDEQIKNILRQKAAYERLQNKAAKNAEGHAGEVETHVHADGTVHEGPAHDDKPIEDINDLEIPELTDEVVKTLGAPGQFGDVQDFKTKLREHLTIEKTREVEAKRRAALTDKIIEESKLELPEILVESELGQMFAQMEEDITRAGLKMDDYLSHMKKTREDLRKEWAPTAEKRARLQLVLNEIAKKENILPDKDKVEEEAKHLLEHYKDADPVRVKIYVASVMQNDAVMKFLESQ